MRCATFARIACLLLTLGIASLLWGHSALAQSLNFAGPGTSPMHRVEQIGAPAAPVMGAQTIDGYAPCDAAAFADDPNYGLDENSGFATSAMPEGNPGGLVSGDLSSAPSAEPPATALPSPTLPCGQPLTAPVAP